MGTYYTIVNHTKKERIDPHDLGDGCKFQEFVPGSGRTLAAIAILLKGGWAGDQIEILEVGAARAFDVDSTYRNISHILVGMVDELPRPRVSRRRACKKRLSPTPKATRTSRSCEGTEYKPVSEMPFNYAFQRMMDGLRVRRAAWEHGLTVSGDNSLKDLTCRDVASDDWEVVKPPSVIASSKSSSKYDYCMKMALQQTRCLHVYLSRHVPGFPHGLGFISPSEVPTHEKLCNRIRLHWKGGDEVFLWSIIADNCSSVATGKVRVCGDYGTHENATRDVSSDEEAWS